MIFNSLLTVHIIAGTISVLAAFVATFSKVADRKHKLHIWSGNAFFWGMLVIFVTAIIMSIIKINIPLFTIAIFSFYMALSGLRFAKNRSGKASRFDYAYTIIMMLVGAAMIIYGAIYFQQTQGLTVILIVFGAIGAWAGWEDYSLYKLGEAKGKMRIAQHLNRMLGGTIATITAVVVTNFEFAPAPWLLWLLPTILITPIIFIWTKKIKAGTQRKGMTN